MNYMPEWNKDTPDVIKAIADAYLLKPENARKFSQVHNCTLLGHKVTLDARHFLVDGHPNRQPSITITYRGWDQTERGAWGGEPYGTKFETKLEQTFEIGNPDFGSKLDQFFWDAGLPVLYMLDLPDPHPKNAHTHTYDLKQTREWGNKIQGSEVRPATYEEIRSVPPGCLAIWMNCQIGEYGCERVEDFKGGLWPRIQHTTPVEIWADRQFKNIVCFMQAFLPAEDRKIGLVKSRKGGRRSRKNTYSASGNEKSRPSS